MLNISALQDKAASIPQSQYRKDPMAIAAGKRLPRCPELLTGPTVVPRPPISPSEWALFVVALN